MDIKEQIRRVEAIEEQLRRVGARHAKLSGQLAPVEEERDAAILQAAAAGLTRRRIAELLGGITFQRVQQIVRAGHSTQGKTK